MAYRISVEQLANDWLYETLSALSRIMRELGMPLYVVGATARDMAMILLNENPSRRKTMDLDVAIAISDWNAYDEISKRMTQNSFEKLAAKQKFLYRGSANGITYEVDLVPFGKVAVDDKILWRPDGVPEMSVRCFDDVMSHAVDVEIGDDCPIKMATLAGQFLIKLDAWCDRHDRTFKDADDMMYIMENYYMAEITSATDIPDDVDVECMDTLVMGAQWIASNLQDMLSDYHRREYGAFLSAEIALDDKSELLQHLMRASSEMDEDTLDRIKMAVNEMRRIINS